MEIQEENQQLLALYDELLPYAERLAYTRFHDYDADICASTDDVIAELLEELVKSFKYYQHLPYIEIVKKTKVVMRNRVGELKHKYYNTYRGMSVNNISLDQENYVNDMEMSDLHDIVPDDGIGLIDDFEGSEFWQEFLSRISDSAREVVGVLMHPSPRLTWIMGLVNARSNFVNKGGCTHLIIKPMHVADALLKDEDEIWNAYHEITNIIQEMYNTGV